MRSVDSVPSGKYYFELTADGTVSIPSLGLSLSSVTLSGLTAIGAGTAIAGTFAWMGSGQLVYVGTTIEVNMGAGVVTGSVCQFAIDTVAKLGWVRLNAGNWNNSSTANPATGTGGIDISSLTGPLYAFCGGGTGSGFTANFGGSSFVYSVPSGFTGGIPSAGGGGGTPTFNPMLGDDGEPIMAHAAIAITPSDTANLPGATVGGIYIGGAGNITVQPLAGGPAVALVGLPVGTMVPLVVNKVFATGTTATNIVGFVSR